MVHKLEDLRISVETIGEAGLYGEFTFESVALAEILADEALKVDKPLKVAYEANLSGEEVAVSVRVEGAFEAACCRCLKPLEHRLDLEIDTIYMQAEADMSEDLEADRESSDIGYYRGEIEIGRFIRSELVLSLPLRYVCSESCRGLCPECGRDLNEGACACEKPLDPRFSKLAGLKNKL